MLTDGNALGAIVIVGAKVGSAIGIWSPPPHRQHASIIFLPPCWKFPRSKHILISRRNPSSIKTSKSLQARSVLLNLQFFSSSHTVGFHEIEGDADGVRDGNLLMLGITDGTLLGTEVGTSLGSKVGWTLG
jgi:hypothetical protein